MKVLLVVPPSDLPFAQEEMQKVSNYLHPTLLLGEQATTDNFMMEVENDYDLIWFSGHGTTDGIIMADGLLTTRVLVQLLRSSKAAIFLNTCESLLTAITIHDTTGSPVIGTVAPIDDEEAYRTGVLFARRLAAGDTLRQAYRAARPEDRQFVFLNGALSMSKSQSPDDVLMAIATLSERMKNMEKNFEEANKKFCDILHDQQMQMDDMRNTYTMKLSPGNITAFIGGFLLFGMSILLLISDIRHQVGIDGWGAAGVVIIFLTLAVYFIAVGLNFEWRE